MHRLADHAPGVALATAIAVAGYLLATLPGGAVVGPLVAALVLGVAVGSVPFVRRRAASHAPGVAFAASGLLKLGIVLLGVRLDARALVELGPLVLAGSVLGAVAAFAAVEVAGRFWRVPIDLRRAVGMGTSICGASAIAAALPLLRARAEHASVAIGSISVLGTVGVLGFAAWDALERVAGSWTAVLAGATLQEVGHVVAVGTSVGGADGDVALLVKLSRVVLLAPMLVALGAWMRAEGTADAEGAEEGAAGATTLSTRPPLLPGFVLGFLALGLATSAGWVPDGAAAGLAVAGTAVTAVAMAAIGLRVDARSLGPAGRSAMGLAVVGFVALFATMTAYYAWVLR